MDIGISFKNLREGKGKSVYALSKETGVSENHIHSIEKGSTHRPLRFWKGCSTHWG